MQDQDEINEEERHEAATETPIGEVKDEGEGEQRNVPLAHFPSGAAGTEPAEDVKDKGYINCTSCEDKFICPHAAPGNFCGTKNGETRPDFGRNSTKQKGGAK